MADRTPLATPGQEKITHLNNAHPVLTAVLSADDAHELEPHWVGPPSNTIAQSDDTNAHVVHVDGLTESHGPHSVCQRQEDWKDLKLPERAESCPGGDVGMVHGDGVVT
jgi:fatty-acyl-CoA synthase